METAEFILIFLLNAQAANSAVQELTHWDFFPDRKKTGRKENNRQKGGKERKKERQYSSQLLSIFYFFLIFKKQLTLQRAKSN